MTKQIQTKNKLEIETVDAFQGKEQDIVIVDLVRTEKVGFLSNHRRMNVALSRAKYVNIMVGNSQNLMSNPKWKQIINYLQKKNFIYPITSEEIKLEQLQQIFQGKFNP
eukprot:TRINITY_DN9492_c0_g1_i1.p2 TRINITY_DN9492_c0_g1~~TRINITY_DN9492_c0_g1_i1.p2  ORF type:complete len:109 (-),score=20.01 TRINITY_DN9492_c0_g1_i1:33-359(-)